ncbi:MAG: phage virion morphogenesis protein [Alistipes sp.]|nr:phage virion morphogenesis protein [Alistipes sp.]
MQNIEQEIAAMMDEICEESSEIIAEEATEYFKERFTEKEWDGTPWPPAKSPKRSGSLLVRSSALLNSIRPTEVTKDRVVITAGNQKVTYAQVHNEGFSGKVNVDAFTRNVKGKTQQVRAHTRNTTIPKRQFMGETEELDERILGRIETLIQSKL